MCFSAEVSLAALILGLGGGALVWSLDTPFDHIVGAFTAFVALMQGIEFLLWRHQRCDTTHKAISVAGMWLNHLQPLVLGGLILLLSTRQDYAWAVESIMALYTAIIVPYSLQYTDKGGSHCTVARPNDPHLLWRWNIQDYHRPLYWFFLACFVAIGTLGMPTVGQGIVFSVVGVGLYLLSKFLFYQRETVGSLWCFFVAFVPIVYYIFRINGFEID